MISLQDIKANPCNTLGNLKLKEDKLLFISFKYVD